VNAIRKRLKTFTWVALLAMCGLAFGPSISRALAPMNGPSSMALHADCPEHAHLARNAPVHPGHSGAPSPSPDTLDCCGLCAVAASPFAAIDFFVPALRSRETASAPFRLGDAAALPAQRDLWSTAVPRGPPPHA
jgi:hypothetical protein